MTRLIDLSVTLYHGKACDPPHMETVIDYSDHDMGAQEFIDTFPGLKREDLPDGKGPAMERVSLTTHNGTHLDAPWHFHPTMDNGKPALTIDEIPLEWCYGNGVKLDLRSKPHGYVCTPKDLEDELKRIGYKLQPFDIVLINTSAATHYGTSEYLSTGCGMGRDATLFLLDQGVKVAGTDAWSWDAPFGFTRKRFQETGDASLIWEGHKAGRFKGYCHLEKLANLDKLPPFGFKVSCFPVKVHRASAGWTRAVAYLDD